MQKNREEAEEKIRSELRGFHSCEESSLGMRSNGKSLPVSYCFLLGQCFTGKQSSGL